MNVCLINSRNSGGSAAFPEAKEIKNVVPFYSMTVEDQRNSLWVVGWLPTPAQTAPSRGKALSGI